jgi:hypothetical protein
MRTDKHGVCASNLAAALIKPHACVANRKSFQNFRQSETIVQLIISKKTLLWPADFELRAS